jgi:hypothetical protein
VIWKVAIGLNGFQSVFFQWLMVGSFQLGECQMSELHPDAHVEAEIAVLGQAPAGHGGTSVAECVGECGWLQVNF